MPRRVTERSLIVLTSHVATPAAFAGASPPAFLLPLLGLRHLQQLRISRALKAPKHVTDMQPRAAAADFRSFESEDGGVLAAIGAEIHEMQAGVRSMQVTDL